MTRSDAAAPSPPVAPTTHGLSFRAKLVLGMCGLVLLTGAVVLALAHRSANASTEALTECGVLRERDGVHLLKITRRLPLRPARCQAGALDRLIVATAQDRAAVLGERNGGDGQIMARHHPTRSLGAEVVQSHLFANPASERPAIGCDRQGQHSSPLGHAPLAVPGGRIP